MGAGAGAAAGAAVGSVAGPIGAGIGAGVGAYTGSLAGAMSQTDDDPESDPTAVRQQESVTDRKSGLHVAAQVDDQQKQKAIGLMRDYGGQDVEQKDGSVSHGEWQDFDPTQPVRLVC